KTRKTWPDHDKATLKKAMRKWWREIGAAEHPFAKEMVILHRGKPCWGWILERCLKIDPKFKRKPFGMFVVARNMRAVGLL
ncbi:hypothetical protein FRC01_005840, partial [Tulasnella sp. 417]